MTLEPLRSPSRAPAPQRTAELETLIPEAELTPGIRAMLAALNGEVDVLRRELQRTRERLERAERVADQDPLLPILNRRAFMREIARHVGLAARYNAPASLLYCDLDGFKRINDACGHAAGDAMLSHLATVICTNVRDSDVVGRLGGDEFGVILAHANAAQSQKKARTLLHALTASPLTWNGAPLAVSFSFGVTELLAGDDPEGALARADEAMYAQKHTAKSATR